MCASKTAAAPFLSANYDNDDGTGMRPARSPSKLVT